MTMGKYALIYIQEPEAVSLMDRPSLDALFLKQDVGFRNKRSFWLITYKMSFFQNFLPGTPDPLGLGTLVTLHVFVYYTTFPKGSHCDLRQTTLC